MHAHAPHYLIEGGAPLYGEVRLSGAKNAVTKMVMASLLTVEPCILRNVPLLGDLDLAIELCRELHQEFKVEHIQTGLADEKSLSFYRQGEFIDLCRGKHIPSTGHIGSAFKLLSVAGAYWKGDASREHRTPTRGEHIPPGAHRSGRSLARPRRAR